MPCQLTATVTWHVVKGLMLHRNWGTSWMDTWRLKVFALKGNIFGSSRSWPPLIFSAATTPWRGKGIKKKGEEGRKGVWRKEGVREKGNIQENQKKKKKKGAEERVGEEEKWDECKRKHKRILSFPLKVHYLCISARTPVANPSLCHIH